MERLEAIVSGKVQGVTYRYFTAKEAAHLGLTGFSENLPDGSVRVVAEGARAKLDAFLARLRKGPLFARVTDVAASFHTASGEFRTFDIR